MICWRRASVKPGRRERKVFVFCARRAGSGNFWRIRNSLLIRGSVWRTYPTAGLISCICLLQIMQRCRDSRTARDTRGWRRVDSSSTTPTSVPTPIIGYQGCRRWRRNMVSRSRSSISLIKHLRGMYPHRSRPMPCSGTVSF